VGLAVAAALVALVMAMHARDLANALAARFAAAARVVYVFGCWKCALPLRQSNPHWLMYALLLNWAGDAGHTTWAGRSARTRWRAGKPKKSWEGAAASVVVSTAVAGAYLAYFVGLAFPSIALTVAANAAGQLGDLAESAMKRGAGVKIAAACFGAWRHARPRG